jgi:hypothetical protein
MGKICMRKLKKYWLKYGDPAIQPNLQKALPIPAQQHSSPKYKRK